MTHPTGASAAYEAFVDALAGVARRSCTANRIRIAGHPVRNNDADLPLGAEEFELRALFARLTPPERETLARALERERRAAVHDTAAFLQWAADCDGLEICWKDEAFGPSPFNTMHADLIDRLDGEDWSDLQWTSNQIED